tara:strand:+ start:1617 stop:2270 length:654 start_codon:yes stop_codon:yes gene_type:complete
MKNKLIALVSLLGLSINAAATENYSADIKYTSDFFFRGQLKSNEAVQSAVGFSKSAKTLKFSAGAFTNQATGTGADTYILNGGVGKSFADDLLSVYAGLNHIEYVAGAASLEAQISFGVDWYLSPRVNVYRDTDDSLYTYELELGHVFDLEILSLGIKGLAGNADTSSRTSNDYYSVSAELSRSITDNIEINTQLAHVNSDAIASENVVSAGISFSF